MRLFGPCLRQIPPSPASPHPLYLTFDDGPCPNGTPRTLDALARSGAKATFFVIAREAVRQKALVKRIRAAGHTIGNHSLDHRQSAFFRGETALREWIKESEETLQAILGEATVGFRSPNGIRTPPLDRVLQDLGLPLVHWNVRFYDAVWPWTEKKALASLATTRPGSIVLLHDKQRPKHAELYFRTLDRYLAEATGRGLQLSAIAHEDAAAYFLAHGEARRWQT